jgi:hypothetical protein
MKARRHKVTGAIATGIAAAGILAGSAQAQAGPDWPERAAGVVASAAGPASTVVPLPDLVDRAVRGSRVGGTHLAAKSTRLVSPPDWFERAVKRSRAGSVQLTTKSTVVLLPDWIERVAQRAIGR